MKYIGVGLGSAAPLLVNPSGVYYHIVGLTLKQKALKTNLVSLVFMLYLIHCPEL